MRANRCFKPLLTVMDSGALEVAELVLGWGWGEEVPAVLTTLRNQAQVLMAMRYKLLSITSSNQPSLTALTGHLCPD